MCRKKKITVPPFSSKVEDSKSCQGQDDVWSRAQDVDTAHHHQHSHQHCLALNVGAATIIKNRIIFSTELFELHSLE